MTLREDQIFLVSAMNEVGRIIVQRVVVAESAAEAAELLLAREPLLLVLSLTALEDYRRAIDIITASINGGDGGVPLVVAAGMVQ